jgi:hypothetical protein
MAAHAITKAIAHENYTDDNGFWSLSESDAKQVAIHAVLGLKEAGFGITWDQWMTPEEAAELLGLERD